MNLPAGLINLPARVLRVKSVPCFLTREPVVNPDKLPGTRQVGAGLRFPGRMAEILTVVKKNCY
ncbi:hypothetical protein A6M21_08635 [Desulfotomaculum copahuensis]|uniref:Uncharacterized protein n=1 Tax=Desulfotomaculum copahuensis TaxID=1838280 RepID=A0A1B7LEZ2_9FIRM|nr:hypothetical protein A6M21_08635 [Desulfotomaculum copahuensis]